MNATQEERLNTWSIEIIEALIQDLRWREEGSEKRALGQGGLSINTRTGAWYSYAAGKGGYSAIPLIMLLKGNSYAEAVSWAEAWLSSHAGTGAGITGGGDDTTIESAAITQEMLGKLEEPAGTQAEEYLQSRGIETADWSGLPVRSLRFARTGESAVVGLLTARGRVVGAQLGYLDAYGRKSLVMPNRRRFGLEKAPDAVFEMPAPANATDLLADTVICEGIEDFCSIVSMGRPWRVVGLPGIGTLRHLTVKSGERIVVIRDGDEPDSPADRALTAGVDHLLLQGAAVRVTETPPGEDANSILQAEGLPGLMSLIGTASRLAELSEDGEITRLSRVDRLEYERQRKGQAEKLGIRVGALDDEVRRRRGGRSGTSDDEPDADRQGRRVVIPTIEPWPQPVGNDLLDETAAAIRQYLVLEPHQADAVALFGVFTQAFDCFEVAPKLIVKSPQKRAGKTRSLEVMKRLVAKPVGIAGISAPALLRMIERIAPTLLLDEFDTMMKGPQEVAEALRGILNSGFDRTSANIIKSVPIPGGGWEERLFSTWCPQILAGIGAVPDTVADRSITIEMKRKLRTDTVKRLRAKDGEDLAILARKAARWVEDHKIELGVGEPETPVQLDDRAADAWSPLLAIADVAGHGWGKRARDAAVALSASKEEDTVETELLADIRILFGVGTETPAKQLSSDQLVAGLIQLEGHPWADINRGHGLTKNGLARRLRPFHITPGSVQIGRGRGAPTPKGYKLEQFGDVFARYLPPLPPFSVDSAARPPEAAENKGFQADFKTPDATLSGVSKMAENASNAAVSGGLAVENDENGGGLKKHAEPEAKPARNGDARSNGHDRPNKPARKRRTKLDLEILAYDQANPGKSLDHLRKKFGGRTKDALAELLGRAL